jgi:hypothetical protein
MMPKEIMRLADRLEHAGSGYDDSINLLDCLEALGHRVHRRNYKIWDEESRRWRSAPRILTDETDAIREVERQLHHLHPGMAMKIDIRWSGHDPDRVVYVFTEITWPSSERQGRGRTPCLAIIAALLRAKANP